MLRLRVSRVFVCVLVFALLAAGWVWSQHGFPIIASPTSLLLGTVVGWLLARKETARQREWQKADLAAQRAHDLARDQGTWSRDVKLRAFADFMRAQQAVHVALPRLHDGNLGAAEVSEVAFAELDLTGYQVFLVCARIGPEGELAIGQIVDQVKTRSGLCYRG